MRRRSWKLSRKGVLLKSWEGELNMGGMRPGPEGTVVQAVFDFSARDPQVVNQLQEAQASGRRVTIAYRQWFVHPFRQDSAYEIVGVRDAR